MRYYARALGSTLVEVLVALVVLGLAVVGLVSTQIQSVKAVNEAYYRSQAVAVAQDIIERIKANPRGWPALYDGQTWHGNDTVSHHSCFRTSIPMNKTEVCDQASEIAKYDHFEVSSFLNVSLPNAKVRIIAKCSSIASLSCVEVSWGDTSMQPTCTAEMLNAEQVAANHCVTINFVAYQQSPI